MPESNTLQQWEYKIVSGNPLTLANEGMFKENLNKMGDAGWELVGFETVHSCLQFYIFKRPKQKSEGIISMDKTIDWITILTREGEEAVKELNELLAQGYSIERINTEHVDSYEVESELRIWLKPPLKQNRTND